MKIYKGLTFTHERNGRVEKVIVTKIGKPYIEYFLGGPISRLRVWVSLSHEFNGRTMTYGGPFEYDEVQNWYNSCKLANN
jgi:hypothetical protein